MRLRLVSHSQGRFPLPVMHYQPGDDCQQREAEQDFRQQQAPLYACSILAIIGALTR